ncbi:hypothetical protein ACHWQZ_G008792 [Mnemiopsis leidyi]
MKCASDDMVDLTITGKCASKNRMITDQTLDREGFCLPEPPQRCNRRIRSAVESRRREQINNSNGERQSMVNRPKSAGQSLYRRQKTTVERESSCAKGKINKENGDSNLENQGQLVKEDFIQTRKMTVNQKWVYQGENPKWKPRNSQVRENLQSRKNPTSKDSDIKQRISVCEVMAKMQRADSPDHSNGASAPPCSPKTSTSAVVGQRFVNDSPFSSFALGNRQNVNYLQYAKSKSRLSRKSVSFLQEDMTVTSQPSGQQEAIFIPTSSDYKDMFSTDEPDEESEVVIENRECSSRVTPPSRSQNDIYKSIYLNNYRENNYMNTFEPDLGQKDNGRLERPKSSNQVRYCPNTYRFHDQQYTRDYVQNAATWGRVQPRLPVGNSKFVSSRRPSNSLYVGTS